MTELTSTVRIDAPREEVWAALADFGGIQKFHPGLRASRSTSSANGGVGATRHCDLKPLGAIEERITEWREGEEMLVHIYDGKNAPPLDFEHTKARISLYAEGQTTRVTMTMTYRLKGPMGILMTPMVKSQFSKGVAGLLKGLKFYVERGEKATSRDLARIPIVAAA